MVKKVLLWIMYTFLEGLGTIGITLFILGVMAGLIGGIGFLIWWGIESGEYITIAGVIVGCIFIFGLIYRVVGRII